MTFANAAIVNSVGGELSPLTQGRSDLPIYKRGVARALNFILLPQGPATVRTGTQLAHYTRLNQDGALIPFQFNDQQAYQIEATNGYFRFYKDESIITETGIGVSSITQANPAVVTLTSGSFNNGDEVFLNGVGGMTDLNGQSYLVTNSVGSTFQITDVFGTPVNTTGLPAYSGGGTASRVYEIKTPYQLADIKTLQFAQTSDTMYIAHNNYEPRKLTRSGHANWTLSRYTRTSDPFDTAKPITGATQANPAVLTVTGHDRAAGDLIYIDSVGGMTQLNNKFYKVAAPITSNSFALQNLDGSAVNSTAYTAYTSGGFSEWINGVNYPRAVTFTADSRLLYGGTSAKPETIFGSCAPTTATGNRYDNFTTGTNDTDAFQFTFAPVNGQVSVIQWLSNTAQSIVAGTFGSIRRVYGATEDSAVTPSAIQARPVNGSYGTDQANPVALGSNLFYIQRGLQGVQSIAYDITVNGYTTTNRNLVADHLPYPGLTKMVFQKGKPDIVWILRADGMLLGMTYENQEDISGWHQHQIGGSHIDAKGVMQSFGKVLSIGNMLRPSAQDQLWMIVERVVNGRTIRTVEYFSDAVVYPDARRFYTGPENEDNDTWQYNSALYEAQKQAVNLDCSLTYDGTQTGASITITGNLVTATANVFDASMVGRQIWGAYDSRGNGGGRATITVYNSPTSVTISVIDDFNETSLNVGQWLLTTTWLSGLRHLEGLEVGVNVDGGPDIDRIVTNGKVMLDNPASVVTIGYKYRCVLETLELDMGGVTGSAQRKPKNIQKTVFNVLNGGGITFGTTQYDQEPIQFRDVSDEVYRPLPLRTGSFPASCLDGWTLTKKVIVVQEQALPCTIIVMDIFADTSDE